MPLAATLVSTNPPPLDEPELELEPVPDELLLDDDELLELLDEDELLDELLDDELLEELDEELLDELLEEELLEEELLDDEVPDGTEHSLTPPDTRVPAPKVASEQTKLPLNDL